MRDECNEAAFGYWIVIGGEQFIGVGMSDVDAARALLMSCGCFESGDTGFEDE